MIITIALIEPNALRCEDLVKLSAAALKHALFEPEIYTFRNFGVLRATIIQGKRADILVLPANVEGYAFGEELRKTDRVCSIIYLADSIKPVLRAFRSSASGYVIDCQEEKQRYVATLTRVANYVAEGISEIDFMNKSKLLHFRLNEVDYFESDYRLVHIHRSNKTYETITERLDNVEARILGGFFRCHQSYLVNLAHICRVDRTTRLIEFNSGQYVYASKALFTSFLNQYYEKSIRGAVAHE